MDSRFDRGLRDKHEWRVQRGTVWLQSGQTFSCGHPLGGKAFLCPYDDDLLLRCVNCGLDHMLLHTPDRCELCGDREPDPLSRTFTDWPAGALSITMPTVAICSSCAVGDAYHQGNDFNGRGAREMESVDATLRALAPDRSPARVCLHILGDLIDGRGAGEDRESRDIRYCGFHAPMGGYCPDCWLIHMQNHHHGIPKCDEHGTQEAGFYLTGVDNVVLPEPVTVDAMLGNGRKATLTGRVSVMPAAYVCGGDADSCGKD